MPILLIVLLVVLIAQIGFWDTFGAILGAFAMIALLVVLVAGIAVVAGLILLRRFR